MTDRLEALERLARLKASGILTVAEFEAEKARILRETVRPDEPSAPAAAEPAPVAAIPAWQATLSRPWLVGGSTLALLIGLLLAYFVIGDIRSATSTPAAERSAAPKMSPGGTVSLGPLLGFRDASTCTPGQGLQDLIDAMLSVRNSANPAASSPVRIAGFEDAVVPTVSRPAGTEGVAVIQIPVVGVWQGLHVTRLHTATWGSDDVNTIQIHLADPVNEARSVLRQIGFPLGEAGELNKAGLALVGIEAVPGGSALTCARGPKAVAKVGEDAAAD